MHKTELRLFIHISMFILEQLGKQFLTVCIIRRWSCSLHDCAWSGSIDDLIHIFSFVSLTLFALYDCILKMVLVISFGLINSVEQIVTTIQMVKPYIWTYKYAHKITSIKYMQRSSVQCNHFPIRHRSLGLYNRNAYGCLQYDRDHLTLRFWS